MFVVKSFKGKRKEAIVKEEITLPAGWMRKW
jgi:hypothetical protein